MDGAFLAALAFGLALAFVAFFALGLRPTLFLPAAVLGPGFLEVEALVVRRVVVRPVCAFGRPAGFAAVVVAYDRVVKDSIRFD